MAEAQQVASDVAGLSIWAVPEGAAAQELHEVIEAYAARLHTPAFLPHMTVLAGVKGWSVEDAAASMAQLASATPPLEVKIERVASKEGLYFQCVFGLLTLSSELANAHTRAKEIFACEREEAFMPHISFIYGDLDAEKKAALVKELRPRLDGKELKLAKLQLWSTRAAVESWEMVAEVALQE